MNSRTDNRIKENDKEGVISPYYFRFSGMLKPGPASDRTWKLINFDGTKAIVKSSLRSDDTIRIRIEVEDKEPSEHLVSRKFDDMGLHLLIRESFMEGSKLTWLENGLLIPTSWFLRESEEAVSEESTQATGPLRIRVRFDSFKGDNFSLPEWSPLPKKEKAPKKFILDNYDDADVIRITQKITDTDSGAEFVNLRLYFAHGYGLTRVEGTVIGKSLKYELSEIIE